MVSKKLQNLKKNRLFFPTVAELVDTVSIDQIKMFKIKKYRESYQKEIAKISHDIDLIISRKKNIKFNARLIKIITTIAIVNLLIWNLKEQMKTDSENYDRLLKLAHQLNGIRNRMKNSLLAVFGESEPSRKRTNTETDELEDWSFKI